MKIKVFTLSVFAFLLYSNIIANDNYWQLAWVKHQVDIGKNPKDIRNFDWDASVRLELEKASNDYVKQLAANNSILYAPEIEDYLNRALLQIYPQPYFKSRFAVLNRVLVTKSSVPDIQVLNNGQILISTGMLSLVENYDELTALLAQYSAQFILDLNYDSYKERIRSGTSSSILGAVTYTATNIVLNRKSDNYEWNNYLSQGAGDATLLISAGLFNFLDKENDKMMQIKADSIAQAYMITKNIRTEALTNIMMKIWKYGDNHPEYSYVSLLAHYNRYPKRLKTMGFLVKENEIKHIKSPDYNKNIAEALSMNASLLIAECNYEQATQDLERITEAGYAIEETYILKALIIKNTQNSSEANESILKLLEQAEKVSTNNSETVDIERALVYYRMNNKPLAMECFLNAKRKIETLIDYDTEEMAWLNKMITRCKL